MVMYVDSFSNTYSSSLSLGDDNASVKKFYDIFPSVCSLFPVTKNWFWYIPKISQIPLKNTRRNIARIGMTVDALWHSFCAAPKCESNFQLFTISCPRNRVDGNIPWGVKLHNHQSLVKEKREQTEGIKLYIKTFPDGTLVNLLSLKNRIRNVTWIIYS